jgi:3-deoxy-D-manno-octulosonate 8-phosphate phosphatase (KDO 8-P phosphatase)
MPEVMLPVERARGVRLLVLDVDGVLTDGGVYLGADGAGNRIELKRFGITDGLGVRLLQESGVEVAIVTGRESAAVRIRAAELGIDECHQDHTAKLGVVEELRARRGLDWAEVACLADDLADLPVLRRAGLPCAVANAVDEVRAAAAWVSTRRGGEGAVRELAEALLDARGERAAAVDRWVARQEAAAVG